MRFFSFFFISNLYLTQQKLKNSSLETKWEDFPFQPEPFTSSYLHRYMQSAVLSTMSRGPASLCRQAQRAGKPLNLSSPIVCTLVDGWRAAPLWRATVKALRLRRSGEGCGPQRTGGIRQMWPDVEVPV